MVVKGFKTSQLTHALASSFSFVSVFLCPSLSLSLYVSSLVILPFVFSCFPSSCSSTSIPRARQIKSLVRTTVLYPPLPPPLTFSMTSGSRTLGSCCATHRISASMAFPAALVLLSPPLPLFDASGVSALSAVLCSCSNLASSFSRAAALVELCSRSNSWRVGRLGGCKDEDEP